MGQTQTQTVTLTKDDDRKAEPHMQLMEELKLKLKQKQKQHAPEHDNKGVKEQPPHDAKVKDTTIHHVTVSLEAARGEVAKLKIALEECKKKRAELIISQNTNACNPMDDWLFGDTKYDRMIDFMAIDIRQQQQTKLESELKQEQMNVMSMEAQLERLQLRLSK